MATFEEERTTAETELFRKVRGQSVRLGAYFLAMIYFGGAAILYVQSSHIWFLAAHARVLAITGVLALCLNLPHLDKIIPGLGWRDDHRNSAARLWCLAMLCHASYLYGFAIDPNHNDKHPFVLLAVVFGGICYSFRAFIVAYSMMIASFLLVVHYASKSLATFDILYVAIITPLLGALVCHLQMSQYLILFKLKESLQARELQLELASYVTAQEQQKRLAAEERQREIDDELQRQNEHLQHVGRVNAMGEMVAGIAHEINQPLNAISLHSGVLRHPNTEETSRVQAAAEIEKLSSQCASIIRRLQGFVRTNSGEATRVNISQIVHDSIALTASLAKKNNIMVVHDPQGESMNVLADEVQIQQVIVNLLRNAFDSMNPPSEGRNKVTVVTVNCGRFVHISVKDQGRGLTSGAADRLFEPFYSTKATGMGIGLAISRSIVERYGGSLEAQTNEDCGMTFSFALRKDRSFA